VICVSPSDPRDSIGLASVPHLYLPNFLFNIYSFLFSTFYAVNNAEFNVGRLAQLVEHLVYTDIAYKNLYLLFLFLINDNRLSYIVSHIKQRLA